MVASPTLNTGISIQNNAAAIGATDKDILLADKNLGQPLQQPRHQPLLLLRQRRQRRGGDLGGDQLGGLRHLTAALGERQRAAAAVVWIGERGQKAARTQPVDHALDGGGVEIDQPAEMVLRTGAASASMASAANWVWVSPSIMRVVKIAVWRCRATRNRYPT